MANGVLLNNLVAKQVNETRRDGNKVFAKGNYSAAVATYTKCVVECLKALTLPAKTAVAGSDGSKEFTAVVADGSKELTAVVAEVRECDGGVGEGEDDQSERKGAIEICHTLVLALSNRSEAYLRLKKYDNALADAEKALELEPTNLKSLNRKGKAFEALHQYEKANACFLAAFKLSPQDEDIRDALKHSKICAQQSLRGEFDLSKFYLNRCKGVFHPCCDFVGPVEIRRLGNGSGRGLFLTRDVTAGELLFVSNAVAIAPLLAEPAITSKGVQFQTRDHEADHLVTKLEQAAQASSRTKQQLLTLPHRDMEQEPEIPSMDLFRPGSEWKPTITESVEEYLLRAGSLWRGPIADNVELGLRRICGIAHFSSYNLHTHTADVSDNYISSPTKRTGVWPLPSFLHHSCFPNCLRMHVGNAMFVRAARDMCVGESLTIAWFDVADPLKARQNACRNWGFLCRCDRCLFEESIEDLERLGKRFFELLQVSRKEWTTRLASLLPAVEEIIQSRADLGYERRNWIRASCIYAYIAQAELLRGDLERRIPFLDAIVDSVRGVAAAGLFALEYSAELLRDVGTFYGKESGEYARTEKRVLEVYRVAYGTQNKKALMALVQNLLKCCESFGHRQRLAG